MLRDHPASELRLLLILTLLELQSHSEDKLLELQVVCPQNGTAVVKGNREGAGERRVGTIDGAEIEEEIPRYTRS